MKDQMYYPSIRFEDMTNLELKLFRALRALIITVGVSSIYRFFSKHFFNTFFHIIYIYSLVGFGALCALGAAGAAGVFENLWKLIFRNSVFIYFWDLRHAVIGGRTISACPGLT